MRKLDPHTLLFALWLFILLNIICRDIHQFVESTAKCGAAAEFGL